MKNILAAPQSELLAQYAWSNTLLAFDFDGTLAPIVRDPGAARMREMTAKRLADVAALYPTVVISGRSRPDVAARVKGIRIASVVGNHGVEPSADMASVAALVRTWIPLLRRRVGVMDGVEIEDKTYSLAIHYRRSRTRKLARARIQSALEALGPAVRVIRGKCVVNAVPAGAPHKGLALQRLRSTLGADVALYVGDDVTDEDVFALDEPGRLLCIRVGRSIQSRAPYYIEKQRDIDLLLAKLARLRSSTRTAQRAEYL